jgi:hypothetical protein
MRCMCETPRHRIPVSDLSTARCINQKDGEERTHQVQLMGLIYKKCQECIVYLGDNLDDGVDPSSTEPPPVRHFGKGFISPPGKKSATHNPGAYEVISFFHDLASGKHLHTQSAFGHGADPPQKELQYAQSQHQMQLFEALRKFTHAPSTPWWTRIWVIQEVTTPPRAVITYGTISTPWDVIALGAALYTHHSAGCCKEVAQALPPDQEKVVTDSCKKIKIIDHLRWQSQIEPLRRPDPMLFGLLSLLTQFRDRKASDPRDKVYALLSMTWTPPSRTPIVPDYSLSETKVFCTAALESIYTTQSLAMFSTELGRKFRSDLPSWAPDWGVPGGHNYAARTEAISLYNASREKATPITVRPIHDSALKLRAAKIMTVGDLGEVMWGDDVSYIRQTLRQWWRLWEYHSLPTGENGPVKSLVDSRFAELICAGVIHFTHDGLPQGVRKVQAYDTSTFDIWAAHSSISPVANPKDVGAIDGPSPSTQLWKQFMLLWPDSWYTDSPTFPNGLDSNTQDNFRLIDQLFQLIRHFDTELSTNRWDYFEEWSLKSDAPWEDLFIKVRRLLQHLYGPTISPDLDERKSSIPDVDNSISIATLSRRLIVGNFCGLGPAGMISGDEVFILTGGKTPFVLRRHDDTDGTVPGPKYEIIGDCYLQGWMDGEGEGLSVDQWEDITLV